MLGCECDCVSVRWFSLPNTYISLLATINLVLNILVFFYPETTVSTIQSVPNLYKLNIFTALTSLLVLKYGNITSD
jgi:hypothetical protein